jgi:hypothetical protein
MLLDEAVETPSDSRPSQVKRVGALCSAVADSNTWRGRAHLQKTVTSNDVNTHRAVSPQLQLQLELPWRGVVYECELLELRCATS